MAYSYESVMNFGISAHYSPNVGEEEFCEVRGSKVDFEVALRGIVVGLC
jgi:hypothetical protein